MCEQQLNNWQQEQEISELQDRVQVYIDLLEQREQEEGFDEEFENIEEIEEKTPETDTHSEEKAPQKEMDVVDRMKEKTKEIEISMKNKVEENFQKFKNFFSFGEDTNETKVEEKQTFKFFEG